MNAEESPQETLLSEEGFIYFPEDLTVGKVYQLPYGIVYAEISGVRIQLDERISDPQNNVWYVLLEDERPVIIGRVLEDEA